MPPRSLSSSLGLLLLTLGAGLALVWATTTPRVRATAWNPVPQEPRGGRMPRVDGQPARLMPGLLRTVYRGQWFEAPVYRGSDPLVKVWRVNGVPAPGNGLTSVLGMTRAGLDAGLPVSGPFTVRWSGYLPVVLEGRYGFALLSDDGAVMRLGGTPVVSDWGPHPLMRRESRVWLKPGLYPLEIEYQQLAGDASFEASWRPPGGDWSALDGRVTRHLPAGQVADEPVAAPGPVPTRDRTTPGLTVAYRPLLEELSPERPPPPPPQLPATGPLAVDFTRDQLIVTRPSLPVDAWALAPAFDSWPRNYTAVWQGLLEVGEAGPRRFRMRVDDGGRLEVDGRPVAESWRFQARSTVEGECTLSEGLHPFRVQFFNGMGEGSLSLEWSKPGQPFVPVPASALRRPIEEPPAPSLAEPVWDALLPDLDFLREQDLEAPHIHRWDSARMGHPARRPRPLLRLETELVVPQSGYHRIWMRAAGEARLALEGQRLEVSGQRGWAWTSVFLNRGPVPLCLDYLGPAGGELLQLEWDGPSFERRPLVARDLGRCGVLPLAWLAALLVLVGLGFACAGFRDLKGEVLARGPRYLLALLFLVSLCVRLDSYQRLPATGETDDELTPHLSGWFTSHGLAPASWDCVNVYNEQRVVEAYGRPFKIVVPFLEYPPLFDLSMGWLLRALAPRQPFDLPLHLTRLVPILLGSWCVVLVWGLALELGMGYGIAFAAASLHALDPLAVLGGRLLKADALIAALCLLGVLATVRYRARGRLRDLALALATIPLAILTKPTGLALGPAVIFPLAAARRGGAAFAAVLATALGVALWLAWGWSWDGPRFFALVRELTQHFHQTNLSAFIPLVTTSRIAGIEWGAAWWTGLFFLGMGGLMAHPRAAPVLSLSLFYLVAVGATYDAGHNYGWYRLPLYPPLALGVALFLHDVGRRADPARAFLAAGLLVLPALHQLAPDAAGSSRTLLQVVLLAAAALPSLAGLVRRWRAPLAAITPALILAVLLAAYGVADANLPRLYPPLANTPDACPDSPLTDI